MSGAPHACEGLDELASLSLLPEARRADEYSCWRVSNSRLVGNLRLFRENFPGKISLVMRYSELGILNRQQNNVFKYSRYK